MTVFDARDEAVLRGAKERQETHTLLELLDPDKNRLFVADVLRALGGIRDHPVVVPAITAYLEADPRPAVQNAGIRSLAKLGDERAAEALHGILTGSDRGLRYLALRALARIGGPSAVAVLQGALGSATPTLRAEMLTALGRIGGPDALELLREQGRNRDPVERSLVADSLGTIGGDEAVALLSELVADPSTYVKLHAIKALTRVGSPAAESVLEEQRCKSPSRLGRWLLRRRIDQMRTARISGLG